VKQLANPREPTVCRNRNSSVQLVYSCWIPVPHPTNTASVLDQSFDAGLESEVEAGVSSSFLDEELQQPDLRQDYMLVLRAVPAFKRSPQPCATPRVEPEAVRLATCDPQQSLARAKLVQQEDGRRMDEVAAELAVEVPCASSTTTSMPWCASSSPSVIPAGPAPTTQQVVDLVSCIG
jgi:hypothetical protein